MSLLYPRLLPSPAQALYEQYRWLPIEELSELAAERHESAVYAATGGGRVRESELKKLRQSIVEVASKAGFPHDTKSEQQTDFDLKVAEILHRTSGLAPAEAAARDIWAFLALVLLPDVACWRFTKRTDERLLATDLTRHVFGRLWWRAELVHDPNSAQPYSALKILGEAAFDQIYARRRSLGGSPQLVRAILRVWSDIDTHDFTERTILRDFLMRLLRLGAFMSFEALEDDQLDAELRRAATDSLRAFAGE
jgi:hypothetical protein